MLLTWGEALLAGKAIFTVRSVKTGKRYTFRVRKSVSKKYDTPSYYVAYLFGPDNENSYSDLGYLIRSDGRYTGKIGRTQFSTVHSTSEVWLAAEYVLKALLNDRMPAGVEVFPLSRCCKCGRALTTPESVTDGIGPECKGKMGL